MKTIITIVLFMHGGDFSVINQAFEVKCPTLAELQLARREILADNKMIKTAVVSCVKIDGKTHSYTLNGDEQL